MKSIRTKRSSKLPRYIMFTIESHLSGINYDFEQDNGTLEQILPENPTDEWIKEFPRDVEESFIYRLGNFTILESDKNRLLGNKGYAVKAEIYKTR